MPSGMTGYSVLGLYLTGLTTDLVLGPQPFTNCFVCPDFRLPSNLPEGKFFKYFLNCLLKS